MHPTLYQNPVWLRVTEWASNKPDHICIKTTAGETITYRQLVSRVNATAARLVGRGLRQGDRVFFLARPSIDSIIYFLATLRAGATIAAADPAMGREMFRSRFELVAPAAVILDPVLFWIRRIPFVEKALRSFGVEIPDIGTRLSPRIIKVGRSDATDAPATEEAAVDPDSDALIVFTSGTTAKPKAVVHTYASISATLDLIASDLRPIETDVFYAPQLYDLCIALVNGATAVLPPGGKFDAATFAQRLQEHGITRTYALPAECEELIKYYAGIGGMLPTNLRVLMLGSAPILVGFLRRLSKIVPDATEVLAIYGATEMLPIARVTMREKLRHDGKGDLLGRPFSNVRVRVEDDELVVSGPNLCRGYFDGEPMREHYTGDLGRLDEEGRIILLGRKKDMIIKGNHNIYPAMFETVIAGIDGVKQCALVGLYREDRSDEDIILVVEKDSSESDAVFRARLKRELASGPHSIDVYAQPDRIVFMPLPLAGRSRKVDKNALREALKAMPAAASD